MYWTWGFKEDTTVSDLSIWQNGVTTYLDGMDGRMNALRGEIRSLFGDRLCETSLGLPVGMRGEGSGRGLTGGTNYMGRKVKRLNPKSSHHKEDILFLFFFLSFFLYL